MDQFTFHQINNKDKTQIPYDLLLLADETEEAINKYISNCEVYLLIQNGQRIGVIALHKNTDTELEIKNMAIIDRYRNKGLGSILINKAKEMAKENHYSSLLVGTSDTGFQQIRFYEKNGFIKKEIRKDFFIKNYPAPVFENGLQMKDMIVLEFLIHYFPE
ncbi:GNAT family N-acetyltransferase [Chryseobacterium paridis]|uniref:GNAT family N-acetyltransferase n=1 Tax=Chryseobacterium paridis TaxID=2800328 RepID=A0ABS1FRX5_9FLAO|nr:GNAT family N-acetyltransferase [Chryseobacterium paridis]MBK1895175.1 GNAT family N-acetyltransferase [Chryseobacterium paridis]